MKKNENQTKLQKNSLKRTIANNMKSRYYSQIATEIEKMFPGATFQKSKDVVFNAEEKIVEVNIISGEKNIQIVLETNAQSKTIFNELIIDWDIEQNDYLYLKK